MIESKKIREIDYVPTQNVYTPVYCLKPSCDLKTGQDSKFASLVLFTTAALLWEEQYKRTLCIIKCGAI